jgi:hypothetical protein
MDPRPDPSSASEQYVLMKDLRAPLKIQSSPKCKAQKKFRRAAYV